jgi:hypothetical protein
MSIFTAALGPIANLAGSWLQGQADKNAAAAKLKLTEAEAKAKIMLSEKTSVADWERIWVDRGFEQLSKAPDWYFYSLGIAISASFGVRGAQAFFKRK